MFTFAEFFRSPGTGRALQVLVPKAPEVLAKRILVRVGQS